MLQDTSSKQIKINHAELFRKTSLPDNSACLLSALQTSNDGEGLSLTSLIWKAALGRHGGSCSFLADLFVHQVSAQYNISFLLESSLNNMTLVTQLLNCFLMCV